MNNRFNPGEIVYWHKQNGNDHTVGWGMVCEEFSDVVYIDYLEPRENRSIILNGKKIPIDEFPTYTRWYKLPRGWNYNTKLFSISYDKDEFSDRVININDPENLIELFNVGALVKASTKFQGVIESEISKEGWRLVKKYPRSIFDKPVNASIERHRLHHTYEEAEAEVKEYMAELVRQAQLSDYEWSVELIDKDLARWAMYFGIPSDTKERYRQWLLARDNVEDIETRINGNSIQWKYWKNKRWNNIEL